MKQGNTKETPKWALPALFVGLVLVFGYIAKTTMDSLNPARPVGGTGVPGGVVKTPQVAGVGAGSPAPGASPTTVPPGHYVVGGRNIMAKGKDPFTVVPDSRLAGVGLHPFPAPVPLTRPAARSTGVGSLGNTTFERLRNGIETRKGQNRDIDEMYRDMQGGGGASANPGPSLKILPPPPPPYTVAGVLIGEAGARDVAILKRDGGTDRKFVVVGDPLEGGFTVTAIESGGVRVKHPGSRTEAQVMVPGPADPATGVSRNVLRKQTNFVPETVVMLPLGVAPGGRPQSGQPRAR